MILDPADDAPWCHRSFAALLCWPELVAAMTLLQTRHPEGCGGRGLHGEGWGGRCRGAGYGRRGRGAGQIGGPGGVAGSGGVSGTGGAGGDQMDAGAVDAPAQGGSQRPSASGVRNHVDLEETWALPVRTPATVARARRAHRARNSAMVCSRRSATPGARLVPTCAARPRGPVRGPVWAPRTSWPRRLSELQMRMDVRRCSGRA